MVVQTLTGGKAWLGEISLYLSQERWRLRRLNEGLDLVWSIPSDTLCYRKASDYQGLEWPWISDLNFWIIGWLYKFTSLLRARNLFPQSCPTPWWRIVIFEFHRQTIDSAVVGCKHAITSVGQSVRSEKTLSENSKQVAQGNDCSPGSQNVMKIFLDSSQVSKRIFSDIQEQLTPQTMVWFGQI